jgi:uncharacterized protein YgbK (DUF1537 family)
MIKISVISDDLTGANDCGGQLVRYGLNVSVVVKEDSCEINEQDVVIYNTDSRSIPGESAYERVKKICEKIKNQPFDFIYKKIDSTMRGNIGEEVNAVFDVFSPDFVIIAPAFPQNGRKVINGIHYLNGHKLEDTEVANDPKTPVKDSYISRLIETQSNRRVEHLTLRELDQGFEYVVNKLSSCKQNQISYITVDTYQESDLARLVEIIHHTNFSVVWAGSSGLINHLPKVYGLSEVDKAAPLLAQNKPVFLVIGSVSETGRNQLNYLLEHSNSVGLEMDSVKVLQDDDSKHMEVKRILHAAKAAFKLGINVALYSSKKVNETREIGGELGFTAVEISNNISKVLGEIAAEIIQSNSVKNLFLTGGDTAQQVFLQLNIHDFNLVDEVESGIPLGRVRTDKEVLIVTKAGNFGSKEVMLKSVFKLRGEEYDEADYRNNYGRCSRSGS